MLKVDVNIQDDIRTHCFGHIHYIKHPSLIFCECLFSSSVRLFRLLLLDGHYVSFNMGSQA